MEIEFLTVLADLYKVLALVVLICICIGAVIAPVIILGVTNNPLWLLLYLISYLVLVICYKLLWLI